MGGHGGLDLQSELEGVAALAGCDAGLAAGADGFKEGLDFKAQWFAGCDFEFGELEAGLSFAGVYELCENRWINLGHGGKLGDHGRIDFAEVDGAGCDARGNVWRDKRGHLWRQRGEHIRRRPAGCALVYVDDEYVSTGVVDGDVLAGLEKAELADALGGDAGSGEVGDAAGFEFDARVGDIDLGGQDGQADGADFANRRIAEGEHDVEIVDHEVEDDVDVERAGGEDGKPVGLKEHGAAQFGLDGEHGGVEALEVAGLQNAAAFGGSPDEVVSFGKCRDQRLFDEKVEARV